MEDEDGPFLLRIGTNDFESTRRLTRNPFKFVISVVSYTRYKVTNFKKKTVKVKCNIRNTKSPDEKKMNHLHVINRNCDVREG